jgi:hypothetical protein
LLASNGDGIGLDVRRHERLRGAVVGFRFILDEKEFRLRRRGLVGNVRS